MLKRPIVIAEAQTAPRPCVHRTVLIMAGLLMALVAALVVLQTGTRTRLIHYRHSLNYPSSQSQELVQIGSLDRG